jgi:ribosomal protein L37AE/L43A
MASIKRSKKPTYPLCYKPKFFGHDKVAWTCRHCGGKSCAMCAHRFGCNRSAVVMMGHQERIFSCLKCHEKVMKGTKVERTR